jgi:hypothetical protein
MQVGLDQPTSANCTSKQWFGHQEVISFVIMPNHFHATLHFTLTDYDLNK